MYMLSKDIVQELYNDPYLSVGLGKRLNVLGKTEFDISNKDRILVLVLPFLFCAKPHFL